MCGGDKVGRGLVGESGAQCWMFRSLRCLLNTQEEVLVLSVYLHLEVWAGDVGLEILSHRCYLKPRTQLRLQRELDR